MNFNFFEEQYYYTTIHSSSDMTKGEKLLWETCRSLRKIIINERDIDNLYRAIFDKSIKIHNGNKRTAYPRIDLMWNRQTTQMPVISIGGSSILFHPIKGHFTQDLLDKAGLTL